MKSSRLKRSYGWRVELPDFRDRVFRPKVVETSAQVDLRPQCPPVYDQGQLGSCTGNSIAAAVEFDLMKQKLTSFTPSRLFIYFNERTMEGTVGQDAGAEIRDGIKSVNSLGVCPETDWPYDESKFADAPPPQCFTIALTAKSVQYESVAQDIETMKACLTQGTPIVLGFTVYDSFEGDAVARTGIVPMPSDAESTVGGHAVMVVGHNDTQAEWNGIPPQCFVVRNSWGSGWGASGYFFMPFPYLLNQNLASDFWAIQVMA